MKMGSLCCLAVVLAFFLSSQNTLAAVDQKWLSAIVQNIRNKYELGDSYSWAVNIPENQDPSRLMEVLQDDPPDTVAKAVSKGEVYQGKRMIATTQSVALSHVLEKLKVSKKSSQGNAIIIYSEEYPNINDNDIAADINKIIKNWRSYAFVFSKVAYIADAGIPERAELFKQQGLSKFRLENIFRCYEPGGSFQCTSCSSVGNVAPACVADTLSSSDEQDTRLEKRTLEETDSEENKESIGGVCRLRRGGKDKKGGKVGKGGKAKKGGKVGKGGKAKKGGKVGKGGKAKKGGKVGKGGKAKKGGKVGKGGKSKKGDKMGKGGKAKKGGKVGKGGKAKKGDKMGKGGKAKKGGKVGKGGKDKKGGKVGKGGKDKKGGKVGKGGKAKKGDKMGKGGKAKKGGKKGKGFE